MIISFTHSWYILTRFVDFVKHLKSFWEEQSPFMDRSAIGKTLFFMSRLSDEEIVFMTVCNFLLCFWSEILIYRIPWLIYIDYFLKFTFTLIITGLRPLVKSFLVLLTIIKVLQLHSFLYKFPYYRLIIIIILV